MSFPQFAVHLCYDGTHFELRETGRQLVNSGVHDGTRVLPCESKQNTEFGEVCCDVGPAELNEVFVWMFSTDLQQICT